MHTSGVYATATSLYVPELHAKHKLPDRKAPEVHAVQYTELLAPSKLVNKLAAHEVQLVEDDEPARALYVPGRQLVHTAAEEAAATLP